MKININIPTNSKKTRILSAFMAFLIFALTFQEAFIGWDWGVRVSAETPSGEIHSSTSYKVSKYTADMNERRTGGSTYTEHTGSNYVYTGKYTNDNKVALFDYVSDYELRSGGSYNTCQQDESGYVDVYTNFNNAISDDGTCVSAASNNVTIVFDYSGTSFKASDEIYVHMWYKDSSGTVSDTTTWPGKRMSYDGVNDKFTYTFNPTTLAVLPNSFIFSKNGDSQTGDIVLAERTVAGHKYIMNKDGLVEDAGAQVEIECVISTSHTGDKYIYLFNYDDQSIKNAAWPGEKMTYKSTSGGYNTYTFSFDSGKYNCFLVNNNSGWQIPTGAGNQKQFHSKREIYAKSYYKYTFNESWSNYNSSTSDGVAAECVQGSALPIYNTKYTAPLYFGDFWLSERASGYTNTNKPFYNNFFWQANMGMKTISGVNDTATTDPGHVNQRRSAAVKGLVGDNLSGDNDSDARGNLLDRSHYTNPSDEVELPYFSTDWADNHSNLMRYYNKDTDGGDLTFPFYEVTAGSGSANATNTTLKSGEVARYYQFDSKEANLLFNIHNSSDANDHSGFFEETNTDILREYWDDGNYKSGVLEGRSNVGFYPFNANNNGNKNKLRGYSENTNINAHNLGFGTKFEMDFQLEYDGCVSAMEFKNGSTTDLEVKDNATRIPTIFEFTGDDDLWVFIDGNLVLDMGGDHNKSHGIINFYDKTVKIDKSTEFGTNSSGTDDGSYDALDASITDNGSHNGSQLTQQEFINKLSGTNFTGENASRYDTNETHTMTIFYMERGMLDSNLSIRYNYAPIANTSRMKIAEVTKFDNVNDGLKSVTQMAAEGDVFKYTVSNTVPSSITQQETPLPTGAYYSSTVPNYTRTAEGDSNWTTTIRPNGSTGTENLFNGGNSISTNTLTPVANTSYWWVDEFTDSEYMFGKSGNDGSLFLMYGTDSGIYGSAKNGNESSAEFEKQFTRNSLMTITQGANVYRLPARDINGKTTLYDITGLKATVDNNRAVADYYTTQYRIIDRKGNPLLNQDHATYSDSTGTNSTFTFNNNNNVNESLSVMLTEFVENTVKVGTISVGKTVKATNGTVENGVTDTFTFKLTLTDVFGTDVDVADYSGIKAKKSGDTEAQSGYIDTNGYFTLTAGQTITIEGIPYNTGYSIAETNPGTNYQQTDTTGTLSGTSNTTTQSGTVINTRLTGELVLTKIVSGNTDTQNFTFNVTLTAPTGINLANYPIKYTIGGTETTPDDKTSFNITLKHDQTAQITGIPQGTTYTVSETDPTSIVGTSRVDYKINTGNWSSTTASSQIDADGETVTVRNTYPDTGSLELKKTVTGTPPSNAPNPDTGYYQFNVVLKAPYDAASGNYVELNSYSIQYADKDNNTVTIGTNTDAYDATNHQYTFSVNVPNYASTTYSASGKNRTITINNIPYGTTYTVEEDSSSKGGSPGVNGEVTIPANETADHKLSRTISSATKTETIDNAYSGLVLNKLLGTNASAYGADATTQFVYHVRIKDSSTPITTGLTVSGGVSNSTTPTCDANGWFTVNVTQGAHVSVSGMPAGATFEVYEETTGHLATPSPSGGSGTGAATSADSPYTGTIASSGATNVTITNNYPAVGSVKLEKELATGTPQTTGHANLTKTFEYEIVFKAPANVTFNSDTYSTYTSSFAPGQLVESTQAAPNPVIGTDDTDPNDVRSTITYRVNVSKSSYVTFQNLPVGTTYTVTEQSESGWKQTNKVYSDQTNNQSAVPTINTGTADTVTITNAQVENLDLVKAIADGTTGEDYEVFEYTVVLTAPTGMEFAYDSSTGVLTLNGNTISAALDTPITYNDGATTHTESNFGSVQLSDSNRTATVVLHLSHNKSRTITNLPYGTEFSVTETPKDGWMKSGEAYGTTTIEGTESNTVTKHYIGAETSSIKNKYTATNAKLGNLDLTKDIADGTWNESDAVFEYTVYLTAPDGMTFTNDSGTLKVNGQIVSATLSPAITYTVGETQHSEDNLVVVTPTNGNSSTNAQVKLHLSNSVSRTISNLPYGTKFSVTETGVTGWTKTSEQYGNTTAGEHFIGTSGNTYKAVNAKTETLTLSKSFDAGTQEDSPANTFTYTVTLTAPSKDLTFLSSFFSVSPSEKARVNDPVITTVGSGDNERSTATFGITMTAGTNVYISGIPYGTAYEVSETSKTGWKKVDETYGSNVNVGTEQAPVIKHVIGAVDNSATPPVTNTYSAVNAKVGDLKLKKQLEGYTTGAPATFTFEVTLYPPTGMTLAHFEEYLGNPSVVVSNSDSDIDTKFVRVGTTAVKKRFTVNSDGTELPAVSDLPYGTTYTVTEVYTHSDTSTAHFKSGEVTIPNEESAEHKATRTIGTATQPVTITNKYVQLGSVTLNKKLTAPAGGTNLGESENFTFNVVLDAPTTIDWTDYPLKFGSDTITGTPSNVVEQGTENVTAHRYSFTVDVPATSTDKVISGIPYGTNYTITETVPTGYSFVSTYKGSDTTNLTSTFSGTVDSSNSAPVYNVTNSRDVHKLTISKTLTGEIAVLTRALGANYNSNANFGITITLTSPAHVDLNNYLSESTLDTQFGAINVTYTARDESAATPVTTSKYVINTTITQASQIDINNVPYGTTYKVDETYSYTGGNGITWTKTEPAEAQIGNSDATAEINNAYVEGAKAAIKIKKKLTTIKTGGSDVNLGEGKSFTYNVSLSNNDVNWTTYGDQLTIGNLVANSKSVTSSGSYTNNIISFQVTVPATDTVVSISGIPDGTTYSISEVSDSDYTLISLNGSKTTLNVTDATINVSNATEYTYSFVNERKQGTLNLSKIVSGSQAALTAAGISTDASGTPTAYTYHVTLEAPNDDVDLADYLSIATLNSNQVPHVTNAVYHAKDTMANPAVPKSYITFDVTLTGVSGNVKSIENIPYGTIYTVVEDNASKAKTSSVTYKLYNDTTGNSSTIGEYNQVTVTNTYPDVGSLELTKLLAEGTSDSSPAEDFIYQVVLTAPTGLDWATYNSSSYITSSSGFYTTYPAVAPSYDSVNGTYTFYVKINAGAANKVTVSNIPYDTAYEVTEILTSDQESAGWMQGVPVYGTTTTVTQGEEPNTVNVTKHIIRAEDSTHNNTYTAYNAKKAELVLYENILNGITIHSSDKFTFTVNIDAPEGIVFTTNYFTFKDKDGSTLSTDNYTVTVSNTVNGATVEGNRHATITATISHSMDHITIGNVPYGSKYEVSGSANPVAGTTIPENSTWSLVSSEYSSEIPEGEQKRVINAPTQSFTAKNAITGGVAVQKTTAGTGAPTNAQFTFILTLSNIPTGLSMSDFPLTVSGTNSPEINGNTITVTGQDTVTITGIPQDVTVTVTEGTMPSANWEQTESSNTANIIIGDGVANTSTPASFTNTYTQSTVTLFKQDSSNGAGIPNAKFYLVKLKADLDITDETVKTAFETGTIENDSGTLKLKVGNTFTDYVTVVGTLLTTQTYPDDTPNNDDDDNIGGTIRVVESTPGAFAVGDRYFFFETETGTLVLDGPVTYHYKKDNSLTPEKVITINADQIEYTVAYDNERVPTSTEVDVKKVDEKGDPLSGAEIELWYKEINIPSTYEPNSLLIPPLMKITTTVNSSQTAPGADAYTTPPTPSTYEYNYVEETPPTITEQDWILPRSDNDYIYFRDFNIGTTGTYSDDTGAFNSSDDNTRWINTTLGRNSHGQSQELIYDTSLWIKAKFTAAGKPELNYSVWERFVDKYTVNGNTYDTVVWKIQPPDGYTNVEFILCRGNEHLRNTKSFRYVLGNIYTKTDKGEYDGGQYGYPVKGEHWSTNWNGTGASAPDKRQSYSTFYNADGTVTANAGVNKQDYVYNNVSSTSSQQAPKQTERYTPTEQKIVFHCNSKVVWHNIHIEFFSDAEGNNPVGQASPGYLMEPYAYAPDNYRIYGYLTYELTIPEGATHFRVNNGVTTGDYAFKSEITPFKHIEGRKNYGNYFKIKDSDRNVSSSNAIRLTEWKDYTSTGDKWNETYSSVDVTSDVDYIYFAAPSTWGTHIYAYFYGGGDLRKHNSLRACYSVWPGVAPEGTEYDASGTGYHSDTYQYTYNNANLYVGTSSSIANAPESTFKFTKNGTEYNVYKFRVPLGDRKNYKKVIFNNGLASQQSGSLNSGGDGKLHETTVIPNADENSSYNAGYIYMADGSSIRHFDQDSTTSFTKRGTGDDYIYIKTSESTWDDMHIVFYDSNGRQILQGGTGYVMEYSGTSGGNTYYRMAIPTNAAKFSLNNGRDKSSSYTHSTEQYDILRLEPAGDTSTTGYTKNRIVYSLTGNNLTLASPTFTEIVHTGTTGTTTAQDALIDYTVRGTSASRKDTLYIRDVANWNVAMGAGTVKFYDADGTLITGDGTKGKGTYTLINSKHEDDDNFKPVWYSIDIPEDAATFTVSYRSGGSVVTTPVYDIYPYSATDTGENRTETGDMYYQTEGTNQLALMASTYTSTQPTDYSSSYTARHNDFVNTDYLYLVTSDKAKWSGMQVTFKDESGTAIATAAPDYLDNVDSASADDPNAAGDWFRIPIPENAKSFEVTGTDTTDNSASRTSSGVIYRLEETGSRYANDYTLGGMEYRLPDTGTASTLLYPVFTETEGVLDEEGGTAKQANQADILDYTDDTPGTLPTHSVSEPNNPYPVLYETKTVSGSTYTQNANSNTVVKEWTDSISGDGKLRFDKGNLTWTTVKAYFYNDSDAVVGDTNGYAMDSDSGTVVKVDVPDGATKVDFTKNGSTASGEHTGIISMAGTAPNKSRNQKYKPVLKTTQTPNSTVYAYWSSAGCSEHSDNNQEVWFYGSNGTSVVKNITNQETSFSDSSNGNVTVRGWSVPDNAYYVQFAAQYDYSGTQYWIKTIKYQIRKVNPSDTIDFDYLNKYARGTGQDSTHQATVSMTDIPSAKAQTTTTYSIDTSSTGTWTATTNGSSSATYTATYQPEDRYGYISDLNAANGAVDNDPNNYIYITTPNASNVPYVEFYTSDNTLIGAVKTAVNGTATGNTTASAGIKADLVSGSTFRVRLPKAANSFKVAYSAEGAYGNTQALYNGSFHHAGTTFTVDAGGNVTGTAPRTGYTEYKTTVITDPLNPRSDGDYVFFTDTSGTFADNGKVYAYFYGDVDGEFVAWPGNVAQTGSNQLTTYTDNNNKTVYMFRVPQSSNGKYKYVIFNNGSAANRNITQAAELTPGKNYVLDTAAANAEHYGTVTTTAYAVTVQDKAPTASASYGNSNKYIYIINNGTQNISGNAVQTSRYILDEMHVVFYDMYNHIIGAESGYIPDRLGSGSTWSATQVDGSDVYRIEVPASAKFFQITNGVNKGLTEVSGTPTDTHLKERYSKINEIADNGLYKFVDNGSSASDYITNDSTVPATENDRYEPKYLLTLTNPIQEEIAPTIIRDVKLATVVTKDTRNGTPPEEGNIDYIEWLKPLPAEGMEYDLNNSDTYQANTVDTEYLDHTTNDIYHPASGSTPESGTKVTNVKVKKTGTYYWKESSAPANYQVNPDEHLMFVEEDGTVYYYDENNNKVVVDSNHDKLVTIVNEPVVQHREVILTKTAKEKVGVTNIGDTLAGAEFKLVKIKDDGTDDASLRFTLVTENDTNKYTLGSGQYNDRNKWLTTGTDGKLHIFNLAKGDYYLEEMKAPQGYSNTNDDGTNKKLYFSVGDTTNKKEIIFADEMEPAYIRLFEHISEKRSEWGDPTFVFRITRKDHYEWTSDATPVWQLTGNERTEQEILVALTVNDDGTITDRTAKVLKWVNNGTNQFFTADPIDNNLYGNWLVEATSEDEYNGLFRIDEQGRIRVEPGKYEITRLPVSRYEFVTSGHIIYNTDPTTDPYDGTFTVDGTEKVTLAALEAGKTADVHYYDKVGYYDKFTQVDEEINKFYKLDSSKNNTTVKGIRVDDYHVNTDSSATSHDTLTGETLTVNVKTSPRFKAYFICVDGSERALTADELAKLNITYTYNSESGDKESFGNATSPDVNDFSYNETTDVITVANYKDTTYKNGVYTLKATYDSKYSDEFDIVFERTA